MPKVGKHIYKRKDGRWEGRYVKEYVNGRARYGSVYAHSYHEAKDKLDARMKEIDKAQASINKAGKVSMVSECWLQEISTELKESSVIKYEDILRCYILPKFGDMELSEITNENLIHFVNDLRTAGGVDKKGLAPSTVSEIITTLNSLRVYAMKRDLTVIFNPECVTVKRDKNIIRVFSIAEEQLLITYLLANMDLTALGILVCLYTGIRVGELCALKWDMIDLKERTMCISKTMQRMRERSGKSGKNKTEVRILEPKSIHSARTIPITDTLLKLLKQYYTPGAFLLSGDKEHFVEPRVMQKRFKRILKNCGIQDANFHATRHSFATRCVELGFDAKTLSEILGHASVTITMNKYVHPTMELKAEHMERFSGLFEMPQE